ncbi:MAG TPA: hypothetical protein VJA47_02675, partial [archaeon]|nr:hypothetical protein [archaeon]
MARLCPNCRQVAVDEFAGGGYVCANCGEQWDTLQALATRTREAGLHRRGSAAGRLEERRRREEEAARARELAEAEEEEGEQAAREAGEATRWPGRIRNRREAERQAREEEARRREQRRIGAEDVRARSRLAERRARGERQAREHIPGFITDARGMGLIAQGLGWFIGGLIISALLGSVLLFIAFLCWAVNSIIRMPADPIRQRMDRIRNRYNQLLQRATSERGRE